MHAEHLYDSPNVAVRKISKTEIGRKYEHLLGSKDSKSNSNSTGSDGAESLDPGDAETLAGSVAEHEHTIIPQKPRKQESKSFNQVLRAKKPATYNQEHFALIEPITSAVEAEK